MTTQWLRSIDLQVGEGGPLGLGGFALTSSSTDPTMLRVAFDIERDEKPWPNSAEIQIWNLTPEHREWLSAQRAVPCRLKAGYRGSLGLLFEGYLRDAISEHQGTDWITALTAGDGELNEDGEPLGGGSIRKTWKRGTPLVTIVKDFAKELKIGAGNSTIVGASAKLSTGFVLSHAFSVDGPVFDELEYFMRAVGLRWSIQDSALQLRVGDVPASIGPLVAPETGLVGHVSKTVKEVTRENTITKAKELTRLDMVEGTCLLLPELKPGVGFVLKSEAAVGTCLCTKATHRGDTFSREWYTQWEAVLA